MIFSFAQSVIKQGCGAGHYMYGQVISTNRHTYYTVEDAKLLEQETREEEPKEMETTEKETKTTDDEPEQQPVKPSSPTEMPSSPAENRPTFEFKGARSNSIAERAKLFEQRIIHLFFVYMHTCWLQSACILYRCYLTQWKWYYGWILLQVLLLH